MGLILPMAGISPIVIVSTEMPAGTATPANVSGAWVTLVGRGGYGGQRGSVANTNQSSYGGGGGGGASVIKRIFIPASLLGSTYQLTAGTTSARFAEFVCGGVTLQAGWGGDGGFADAPGVGGVVSGTGIDTTAFAANGSDGATGGTGYSNGSSAVANTSGGATGGGGGGGARSSPGSTTIGGSGGAATGPLGKNGGPGGNGTGRVGNGATGGYGGAGGGYTAGGTYQSAGLAYTKLEWV